MSSEKTFNPDYEYRFWFYKHKFQWIMKMLGLVIDYDFADGEIEGMELAIIGTSDENISKWMGGLHYGNKGTFYINLALDAENQEIVHVSITTKKHFQSQLELIDLLQCKYQGFY